MKSLYKKWIFPLSTGTVLTLLFFVLDIATRMRLDKPALLTPLQAIILASAAQVIMGIPLYFFIIRFFKDNTLVNQDFIKDNKLSVAAYVKSLDANLKVTAFERVALG